MSAAWERETVKFWTPRKLLHRERITEGGNERGLRVLTGRSRMIWAWGRIKYWQGLRQKKATSIPGETFYWDSCKSSWDHLWLGISLSDVGFCLDICFRLSLVKKDSTHVKQKMGAMNTPASWRDICAWCLQGLKCGPSISGADVSRSPIWVCSLCYSKDDTIICHTVVTKHPDRSNLR